MTSTPSITARTAIVLGLGGDLVDGLLDAADWFLDLRDQGIDMLPTAHLKLAAEATEVAQAPNDLVEVADVMICLVADLLNQGWTLDDLGEAVRTKMIRNRARTWARTANGTWQHVKAAR